MVNDVSGLLRREFARRARGFGLTRAQWMLLVYVARHPEATPADLAEILQQEKVTVRRHAHRLEQAGWLRAAAADAADPRRAPRLQLTPKALDLLARLADLYEQLRRDAFRGLPPTRCEALISDLLQVKVNLQRMLATGTALP